MKTLLSKINPITLILGALVLILFAYIVFSPKPKVDTTKTVYDYKMDSLATVILDLKQQQLQSDSVIACYSDSILKLDRKLLAKKRTIIKIRKNYENKIKTISNYSPSQLSEFFAKRYK